MVDPNRRAALWAFAGLGAAATGLAFSPARAQDQKLAKDVAQYQDTPKDGNECDKCVNFVAPRGCTIVAGDIDPKGWCIAFAPKQG